MTIIFKEHQMPYEDIINALNDVGMRHNKEQIFIEVLNLRAYVARLKMEMEELEKSSVKHWLKELNSL